MSVVGQAGGQSSRASVTPVDEPVAESPAPTERSLARLAIYPVLLAIYPVLLLYSDNLVDVPADEVLVPLVVVGVATAIAYGLLALLWGAPRRAAIVVSAFVLPFMAFGLIADAAAPLWPHEPIVRAYLLVLALWVALVAASVYVALRLQRRLGTVTEILNIVSVVLVVLAVVPIVTAFGSSTEPMPPDTTAALMPAVPLDDASTGRDIYHLVFDRYGSDRALRDGLDIDNSEFSEWLRSRGFQVLDDARANYERTALSLASVHSMSLHDDLADAMGPQNGDLGPLYERIRNSVAAATLQQQGYRYYHVGSWFSPTAESDIADVVFAPQFRISFASTLLDRSAIAGLDAIVTMATTLSAHGTVEKQAAVTEAQFDRISTISDEPGRKLVFAHVLIPHDPYLFLADGTFDPAQASFETQLEYANARIRELVEPLLELPPEQQPIIILQADEGPYPARYAEGRDAFDWETASDEELAPKFGVFNAMYLPGEEGLAPLPERMSLVNTYPEVLRRYVGVEIDPVPDRTYTLRDGRVYDQTDVTDRLDAAISSADPA